jgi:hypothetical protein
VSGDGRLVNALSTTIRRRAARRARRILEGFSLDDVRAVDFAAWRTEVRALAAAVALERTGGDLRTALVAAGVGSEAEGEPAPGPRADLTAFVQAHPSARALVRRAVLAWLEML